MARTVYKTKMDNMFATSLALEGLEFSSFDPSGDSTEFDHDDVFADVLKGSPVATEFSAQDLLAELDFQDGCDFMDLGWMTEKVDLSDTNTALCAEESLSDLSTVLSVDLPPLQPAAFESPEDNLCVVTSLMSEGDSPLSPEQKVPDFLMSPASVASPSSISSDEMGALSPGLPPSPEQSCEAHLPVNTKLPKQRRTPYSRCPTSPGVKPKVKTPEQKERKRAQNKNAATRYRIKKRDEHDGLLAELEGVEHTNTELKDQVASLSKEIKYLKNLLLEVCKAKLHKQAV